MGQADMFAAGLAGGIKGSRQAKQDEYVDQQRQHQEQAFQWKKGAHDLAAMQQANEKKLNHAVALYHMSGDPQHIADFMGSYLGEDLKAVPGPNGGVSVTDGKHTKHFKNPDELGIYASSFLDPKTMKQVEMLREKQRLANSKPQTVGKDATLVGGDGKVLYHNDGGSSSKTPWGTNLSKYNKQRAYQQIDDQIATGLGATKSPTGQLIVGPEVIGDYQTLSDQAQHYENQYPGLLAPGDYRAIGSQMRKMLVPESEAMKQAKEEADKRDSTMTGGMLGDNASDWGKAGSKDEWIKQRAKEIHDQGLANAMAYMKSTVERAAAKYLPESSAGQGAGPGIMDKSGNSGVAGPTGAGQATMNRQAGAGAGQPGDSADNPVQVSDKAAYDRLPSGTYYIAPDGKTRVKQ